MFSHTNEAGECLICGVVEAHTDNCPIKVKDDLIAAQNLTVSEFYDTVAILNSTITSKNISIDNLESALSTVTAERDALLLQEVPSGA